MGTTVSDTDGSERPGMCRPAFEVRQSHDPDGALRVTLIGELDLAVKDHLRTSLRRLTTSHRQLRLDLSQLQFIDCAGVDGILRAVTEARGSRCALEVDRVVSPTVGQITSLAGLASVLWPPEVATAGQVSHLFAV